MISKERFLVLLTEELFNSLIHCNIILDDDDDVELAIDKIAIKIMSTIYGTHRGYIEAIDVLKRIFGKNLEQLFVKDSKREWNTNADGVCQLIDFSYTVVSDSIRNGYIR